MTLPTTTGATAAPTTQPRDADPVDVERYGEYRIRPYATFAELDTPHQRGGSDPDPVS